ncbi:MAG: M81 family metallopeptidase [Alphaproteobacteria bacterium]
MSSPRIAIAGFQHETNTFAPMPTRLEDFARGGAWPELTTGRDVIEVFTGLNIPLGGFIEAAGGFELVPVLWAGAEPGGYVEQACFDSIARMICDGIAAAGAIEGVYLDLHGAMVTEDFADGEGELLRQVREIVGPDLPLAVSLDLHGNMTPKFAEHASSVAIYRTYPHVDMAQTGARAATLMRQELARGAPFAKAFRQADFIPPITDQSTRRQPGARLYGLLPGFAGEGVCTVEFAFGFPPADIWHCGPSVFAYGSDQGAVDRAADAMLAAVHAAEGEFGNPLIPAGEAVRRAMKASALSKRPVVICDPQDNPGAGAVGDSTGLLAALIDEGATSACIGVIWDPDSAAQAHAAGAGATIEASIGGRFPEVGGPPVRITAQVERLSDGNFTFTGPFYGGAIANLGPMACLRVRHGQGDLRIVVGSARAQNADQEMFRTVGIEPGEQRIVAVKSAVHFLADYEPIAEEVIFAAAPGANPCALDRIPYRHLRPGVRLGALGPPYCPQRKETE